MIDPLGDDYAWWCEANQCPNCEGVGEDYIEDEWNETTQDFGTPWTCPLCGGTGIDPAAAELEQDCEEWGD